MINVALARASNDLIVVAVIAYALAMLGYAAELAFSRRERPREPLVVHAASDLAAVPELALWIDGQPATPFDEDADRADVPTVGPRGRSTTPVAGRVAVALTVLGWAAHVASVSTRGLAAHRVPWGNMYEFSSTVTLAAVTAYLVLLTRRPVRFLGAFIMLPVVLTLGIASTVLYSQAEPLVPALNDYWIKIHVVAAIIAWGTFMVGATLSVLYLVRVRIDARTPASVSSTPGDASAATMPAGLLAKLPEAARLDRLAYSVIAFGFPIWTFAIIAGAIWAERAWGRYWGWDPKETWSFITWVIYAGYLHARSTAGWKGRRAAWISLAGFAALTIDYYIVNIFIVGLHSYAGL